MAPPSRTTVPCSYRCAADAIIVIKLIRIFRISCRAAGRPGQRTRQSAAPSIIYVCIGHRPKGSIHCSSGSTVVEKTRSRLRTIPNCWLEQHDDHGAHAVSASDG